VNAPIVTASHGKRKKADVKTKARNKKGNLLAAFPAEKCSSLIPLGEDGGIRYEQNFTAFLPQRITFPQREHLARFMMNST